jgi:hypothetical protein
MILAAILLMSWYPQPVQADIGTGIIAKYDVGSSAFHTGVDFMITAFDRHIRAVGQGTWAEETMSADKQVGGAVDIMWVPFPKDKFNIYVALASDLDYLKTEYTATAYMKGSMGFGGVLQFGKDRANGLYLGWRQKAIGGGEKMEEIRGMLIMKL